LWPSSPSDGAFSRERATGIEPATSKLGKLRSRVSGRGRSSLPRPRRARFRWGSVIERFFGTLKAEWVWQQRFRDLDHAIRVITGWMERYHEKRAHQALGYLTPREYPERLAA
jgi:hypothetical protein